MTACAVAPLLDDTRLTLIWPQHGLIVELDGPQLHLDATEDLRKQHIWETAGWTVRRLPTDDVHLHPERLLALSSPPSGANVGHCCL